LKKNIWIYLLIIIIAAAFTLIAFWIGFNQSQQTKLEDAIPAESVIVVDQRYLSREPHFPSNTSKITKIFLESASTYWINYSDNGVNSDVPAIMVNGTIRNDYTTEEIVQLSQEGISTLKVGLVVRLYDEQDKIIGTIGVGNPFRGHKELDLKGGDTTSYEIILLSSGEPVDYIEIYVSWLKPKS